MEVIQSRGGNRHRIKLFILIFFLYTFCCLLTSKLDRDIDNYYKTVSHPSVFDIGYYILPNLSKYEVIAHVYFGIFIIVLLFTNLWEEFLGFLIPIIFIRLLFIHITILPKHRSCNIHEQNYLVGGCYDKIFSGHFAFLLLITLLLEKYNYISLRILIVINVIHFVMLLVFRWHYTIDIIIALFVTVVLFHNNINIIRLLK